MKMIRQILGLAVISITALQATAQSPVTYKRQGYTLTFSNNDATLPQEEQQRIINTFFETYPKLAKEYNKRTLKAVEIKIDSTYKGVAATSNGRIVISPKWLHQHPEDIDVVTHEGMHIVQDYKETVGPGWLTEGIADYARWQLGINNKAANWKLPAYKSTQSYENSYRITARFLLWIEQRVKKGTVKALDSQLRDHTFTADSWKQTTGKTLDELWAAYQASPLLATDTKDADPGIAGK